MPRYDKEFREQAVELLIRSGKTTVQVARELGVSASSLREWRDKSIDESLPHQKRKPDDLDSADPAKLLREVRRLQAENRYLKTQREILKKAVSILGEDPQSGMR